MSEEIVAVPSPAKKGEAKFLLRRRTILADTTLEALAKPKPDRQATGTITAGNASGVNDGGLRAPPRSESAVRKHGPHAEKARVLAPLPQA